MFDTCFVPFGDVEPTPWLIVAADAFVEVSVSVTVCDPDTKLKTEGLAFSVHVGTCACAASGIEKKSNVVTAHAKGNSRERIIITL